MKLLNYKNGNVDISISSDGTRLMEYEDEIRLEQPMNIDIRVSTSCSFANNICKDFCYENAVVNGKGCDYNKLKSKLDCLESGIELAIGCNHFTDELYHFCEWATNKGFICNLTINQGHIKRDIFNLIQAISNEYIIGLGISYRKDIKWNIPIEILNYKHSVFHVILGIDTIQEVEELFNKGVNKILILGEKNVGYNTGKVNLDSLSHKQWRWWISRLFDKFNVVAFDNLAEQQLQLRRFFTGDNWNKFHQGEYSFYIDAVNEFYSPSSRNIVKTDWNDYDIIEYFKTLNN